jgi:membrane-associated protease RseP (regulator of RpoE activity)
MSESESFPFPAPSPRRERIGRHVVLLALTVVTTTFMGAFHYLSFSLGLDAQQPIGDSLFRDPMFYARGVWYSATVLAILGCHEMGHYLACRYYRVNASLPYFLPLPPPLLTGTLGAFIRIRDRIPSRVALFDIGIAGPIAGFLVALPALFLGIAMSTVEPIPEDFIGYELGEPLLFQAAAWLVWGDLPDSMTINLHPMGFAAWFGLFATALNLFPIGQLDGGHVTYAVLRRRSIYVTLATGCLALGLVLFSRSWLLWCAVMLVMLLLVGPHHPPTANDDVPIGRLRIGVALLGLLMLIVCFTPAPLEVFVMGQ